jgi:hypothetical protein
VRDLLKPPLNISLPNIGMLVVVSGLVGFLLLLGSTLGPAELLTGKVTRIMPMETTDAGHSVINAYVDLGGHDILVSLPLRHNCEVGDMISVSHSRSVIGNLYGMSSKGCSRG